MTAIYRMPGLGNMAALISSIAGQRLSSYAHAHGADDAGAVADGAERGPGTTRPGKSSGDM